MMHMKTILHPTDFSDRSQMALRLACSLAYDHGARLVVVHVVQPPVVAYGETITRQAHDELLRNAQERLSQCRPTDPSIPFEVRLEEGSPAARILAVASDVSADMIVMGTHGRTGLSRVLMGSVAEEVLRKAPCPVVVVKAQAPLAEREPSEAVGAHGKS